MRGPKIILAHVRIIDGTGAPAIEDQNLILEAGKIAGVEKGSDVAATAGATVLDLHGYTVIQGWRGVRFGEIAEFREGQIWAVLKRG